MDWSSAHTVATWVLVAVLAVASWRHRVFVPLLAFFAWMLLVDYVRDPLVAVYRDAESLKRLWLHIDQGLYLSVIFAFVWAFAVVFRARHGVWLAVGGWAVSLATLVIGRGHLPDGYAAIVYAAGSIVALLVCWWLVVRAVFGSVRPTLVHLAAMLILAGDTVSNLYGLVDMAPEGLAAFAASWDAILAVNVVCFALSGAVAGLAATREPPGAARAR